MFPPVAAAQDSLKPSPAIGQPESQNLTSESAKPVKGPSRRQLLSGLAALPAVEIPLASAAEPDPIFTLIEAKRVADVAHEAACHALNEAERRYGFSSDEADAAWDAQGPACHAAFDAAHSLVSTPPTTLAGLLAVLRFVNGMQDRGSWPEDMDLEQQLLLTTATAIEAIIRQGAAA
jgi:hypothetical protein